MESRDTFVGGSSYPPCRWFRRTSTSGSLRARCYPPCRWFRSRCERGDALCRGYPPCRWFRSFHSVLSSQTFCYPPCRWFRRPAFALLAPPARYPPCRRFKNISSCPFFEKFRHLAAGTLAFDPVHDLGKLSAIEDEGKAPIPGVDTLPTLWVGSLCIHECPLLDVLPSALLPQYRGRFVF